MAIFGWTDTCVAVQPSDPVVALAALDAEVELAGPQGRRTLAVAQLHVTQEEAAAEIAAGMVPGTPEDAARIETRLRPGELILGYQIPIRAGIRSAYVKVRERASYEYALVSAAAVLSLENGSIAHTAVALGSVAQKLLHISPISVLVVRQPAPDRVAPSPGSEAVFPG